MAKRIREMLEVWNGYVTSIQGDTFTAQILSERSGACYPDEEATFPTTELSKFDRKRLAIGSYLKWEIYKKPNGKTCSHLWLRRHTYNKRDLERATREANRLWEALGWGKETLVGTD